jgi:hypothetical protein
MNHGPWTGLLGPAQQQTYTRDLEESKISAGGYDGW